MLRDVDFNDAVLLVASLQFPNNGGERDCNIDPPAVPVTPVPVRSSLTFSGRPIKDFLVL
jgi:hypothetical protein